MLASGLLGSRALRLDVLHCRAVAALSAASGAVSPLLILARRDVAELVGEHGPWGRAVGAAIRAHLVARAGRLPRGGEANGSEATPAALSRAKPTHGWGRTAS